jgi:urea transporter
MKTIKQHLVDYLRAISQAFFLDDARFGFALLILLLWINPPALISALIASISAYAYSVQVRTPRILKAYGIITINGFFLGLALAHFFVGSVYLYFFVILAALGVAFVVKAAQEVLQHWKLTPLIAPYILVVWTAWLCRKGFPLQLRQEGLAQGVPWLQGDESLLGTLAQLSWASLQSTARVLFVDDAIFGLTVLGLLTLFSPRRGGFFLLGTWIGTFSAFVFLGGQIPNLHGIYGFSAGLVGIGLASSPERIRFATIAFFCAISSLVMFAMAQLLGRADLPVLSLPYVVTLWLAALSRTPRVSVSWARPSSEA